MSGNYWWKVFSWHWDTHFMTTLGSWNILVKKLSLGVVTWQNLWNLGTFGQKLTDICPNNPQEIFLLGPFESISSCSWQSFFAYWALVSNHFLRYLTLVGSLFSNIVSSSWQSFFKIKSFSWQSFSKIWSFSWQLFSKRQNDKESTCYMSVKLGWVSKIL